MSIDETDTTFSAPEGDADAFVSPTESVEDQTDIVTISKDELAELGELLSSFREVILQHEMLLINHEERIQGLETPAEDSKPTLITP